MSVLRSLIEAKEKLLWDTRERDSRLSNTLAQNIFTLSGKIESILSSKIVYLKKKKNQVCFF